MPDLEIRVTPRASSNRVGPYREGVLAVRVTRPPADGEANQAVVRLVAGALGIAPRDVEIVSGQRGRSKRIRVDGIGAAELERRLLALGAN